MIVVMGRTEGVFISHLISNSFSPQRQLYREILRRPPDDGVVQ